MTAVIPAQRVYDSPEVEIADLVARAQAGDREALGELYARNYKWLFRKVFAKVGNYALAEDLVADVFTRMVARIGTFKWQGSDFAAWLNTIARNRICDYYKSGQYRQETFQGPPDTVDRSPEGSPDLTALAYLGAVELLEAVKRLTEDQRRVIVLRFLNGLSVAETAEAMGRSTPVVKSLQYRATLALGRLLPAGIR